MLCGVGLAIWNMAGGTLFAQTLAGRFMARLEMFARALRPVIDLLLSVQVQHDFNRNKFFDAQEAKDYGIVDQIIRPPRSQSLGV